MAEWRFGSRGLARDEDLEAGFPSRGGSDADLAAVGLDGTFDDGEPEAGAFDFALRVVFLDAIEAPENVGQVGARDADAVVRDPDAELVALGLAADLDDQAGVGVLLQGVFDEVEEHLGPVEAIAHEHQRLIGHGNVDLGLLLADDGLEAFEDVVDAGAETEGFELERIGLAGFKARNDQHVLHDARDAVGVLAHHREEAPRGGGIVDHVVIQQVFEITVDDRHGGAQFVRGVRDEVLADLLDLIFGRHVPENDTGEGRGIRGGGKAGRIDDPGVDAAVFLITAWRSLLGQDHPRLDRFAAFDAVADGLCKTWIEEDFGNRAADDLALAEEPAGGGVAEENRAAALDEHEGVAEGVEQAVALLAGLLKVVFKAEFPGVGIGGGLAARAAEADDGDDERGEGRECGENGDPGGHSSAFAT